MKRFGILFFISCMILSSCSTYIGMQKSYPPQYDFGFNRKDFVFVNYFDYVIPEYIKDKNEIAYRNAVDGFARGLISGFSKDITSTVRIADTLARGYTTGNMQNAFFMDSVVAVCERYRANMLVALDSVEIWFDWETEVAENEDGSVSKTKNFYLYVRPFISLYSAQGETLDRCFVEQAILYKSRPTLSGLITIKPSLAKASKEVNNISFNAGLEFVGKFYPSSENVVVKLYNDKIFDASIQEVKAGNLGHAVDLLTPLTQSADKKVARKASHNLSVVNEMIENKRNSIKVLKNK